MKRFTAFIVMLVIITSLLLTACGGNGHTATDLPPESSGTNADASSDTSTDASADNSDQSGEEAEPLYKGDVYLDIVNRKAPSGLIHTTPDFSANLPNTLKVLNQGKWQEVKTEIDLTAYWYVITIGEDKVYYETKTNSFYDPKRNMKVFARQAHLGMTASVITAELEGAVYKYPRQTFPNTPKAEYAKFIEGKGFRYNATGYEVKLTFADVVNAKNIEVHRTRELVAVYDGKRTHVFNWSTGELIASQDGQFLGYGCDNGGFMEGAPGTINGKRCIYYEERENAFYLDDNHWHEGGADKMRVYFTEDKKTAYCPYGENDFGYDYGGYSFMDQNNYVACRYGEMIKDINKSIKKWEDVVYTETIGKYGVVFGGETVIPFEFDKIDTYQGIRGYNDTVIPCFGVYRAVKNGKTYYYSTNGTNLTPDGFVCGSQPRENHATVYDGKKLFVIEFTTEEIFDPAEILVAADKGVICVPVGKEVGEELYKIITSDGWVEGTTDCHYDYKFCWDETRYYYYDSVCGTFAYLYQKQYWYHKTVSEEQRNIINRCLDYEDVKPPVEAIPPSEELYGGYIYIFTRYGTYYEVEKHDQSGTHNQTINQILINADWQEGNKSSEDYQYIFECGHNRIATVKYNEFLGLLWDKENNRYAYIDRATNLRLAARMRAPSTAVSGVEKTEQFTVAPYTVTKHSVADTYFIGINEKGEYIHIVWDQSQELSEGYVVNVTYDTPFVLANTVYDVYYNYSGYDPELAISAYDVTIVKKPEPAPLDKNREIDFTVSQYETYLKDFYGEQFGKNGYAIVITNLDDLTRFETAYPSTADRGGIYVNLRKYLTDRYFEEKTLIMLYATNQYLFTDYKVNKVTVNNGVLTADYTVNSYPGLKPTMVPDTLIILEVKNADISDCTDFKFNGTINAPEKPKVEVPDTVDYEFYYNYCSVYSNAPKSSVAYSVTSYDVLKDLLENKYRLKNSDPQDKSPVESKLYELDEEFFKEKALICVVVNVNTSTNCEDLMSLKIHTGLLMAERSDELTDEATRSVLCYFIVDKDLVYAFGRCNVFY